MGVSGNKPIPVEQFGGLNLRDDPSEVGWGAAIDAFNVDLDHHGRGRSRNGTEKFTAAAAADSYIYLMDYPGLTDRLIAGRPSGIDALNGTGGVFATAAYGAMTSGVMFGTPAATVAYLAFAGGLTLRTFNGTVFAAPTATVDGVGGRAMPKPNYLGVTPWDNRLAASGQDAAGGPNGSASSVSHLHFSDPGDGASWQTNNYVQLTPGDGEAIGAIVAWREMLFVFKETKYFVFTGTSTAADGTPVFNYRTVHANVGVGELYRAVAAPDGVYFSDAKGVYRTTGGEPELVSLALDPVFVGDTPGFFTGINAAPVGPIACVGRRIVVAVPFSASALWVYDPDTRWWTYWEVPGQVYHVFGSTFGLSTAVLYYTRISVSNDVMRMRPSLTTDGGAAFASRYRSGFAAPGGPGAEATIRETEMTGQGTVGFAWSRDFGALDTPANVVLGSAPATARGYHRVAKAGENLSWQVSSVAGGWWQLNRVVPMLREIRGAGEKT